MVLATLVVPLTAQASALPDNRVYEQVSPALKNGFDAGAPSGFVRYAMATADGDGVFFGSRGPMGEATRGLQEYSVGRRGADGWRTVSAVPPTWVERLSAAGHAPLSLLPSSDLSSLFFDAAGSFVPDNPEGPLPVSGALNLGHADGSVEWVTRPQIPNPVPAPGDIAAQLFQPVGGTPDLSTVYFWGNPTLLAQDAARAPSIATAWGLYEYSNGTLGPAGTVGPHRPRRGTRPGSSPTICRRRRLAIRSRVMGRRCGLSVLIRVWAAGR
jgi:hypothetical protein